MCVKTWQFFHPLFLLKITAGSPLAFKSFCLFMAGRPHLPIVWILPEDDKSCDKKHQLGFGIKQVWGWSWLQGSQLDNLEDAYINASDFHDKEGTVLLALPLSEDMQSHLVHHIFVLFGLLNNYLRVVPGSVLGTGDMKVTKTWTHSWDKGKTGHICTAKLTQWASVS